MANHLAKEAGKKFGTQKAKLTAVAGFVFLRFFCPPLSSPDSFGLMNKSDISESSRRGYILVGKIVQVLLSITRTLLMVFINHSFYYLLTYFLSFY
jgi:hypothetical protein